MYFELQKTLLQELSGYLAQTLQKIQMPINAHHAHCPFCDFLGGKWAMGLPPPILHP